MMGLMDATYYLSWFILFLAISILTAIITVICCAIGIFTNVDMFIFFLFNIIYSMSLFGQAWLIVAFIPTKKSSGIAATLFHIITYYLHFVIRDPSTPSGLLYGMSILPNICLQNLCK